MLTDVYLQSLTAWQYVCMHFQSPRRVRQRRTSSSTRASRRAELVAQGFLQMSDSKQDAEVAAFSALGWKIPATPTGAVVTGVVDHSPARSAETARRRRDRRRSNAKPVHVALRARWRVHALAPGTRVEPRACVARTISAPRASSRGASPDRRSTMTTAAIPEASVRDPRAVPGSRARRSWLGVALEDGVHYALPGAGLASTPATSAVRRRASR